MGGGNGGPNVVSWLLFRSFTVFLRKRSSSLLPNEKGDVDTLERFRFTPAERFEYIGSAVVPAVAALRVPTSVMCSLSPLLWSGALRF